MSIAYDHNFRFVTQILYKEHRELTPITLRQRLDEYEFSDEQEMTLTLELVNRIEKDIDEIKATQPRQGFTLYLVIAGIAGTLYVLFSELGKLSAISFSETGIILLATLLLLKIPWAFYQLVTLDHATKEQHKPGRFFWSNDFSSTIGLRVSFN